MPTTHILTLACSLLLFNQCSILQNSQCDELADALHDASAFICHLATQNPQHVQAHRNAITQVLNHYITTLSDFPPTPDRDKIITRLQTCLTKLQPPHN